MSKSGKIVLIGAGVLLVVGVAVLSAAKRRQPSTEVRLEKVGKRDLTSVVTASGKIEPKKKVDVSSDITGRIVSLPVKEGDMVTRGEVVVHIDPAQYEAAVQLQQASLAGAQAAAAQAQANKDQAERAFVRNRDIRAQNAQLVSQEALEQAETANRIAVANLDASQRQVDQARAGLLQAQDNLRKTTILAPMSGRVTRLAVEEGEVAVPGTFSRETGLLMTISDLSVIQVQVNVDETDVVRIHVHDSTEISIDAFPDTTFTGRVTEIKNSSIAGATATAAAQLNQDQAVDYEVIVTLDNPPPGVRPDLSATARIISAKRHGTLTVPIIALTVRQPADTLSADSAARGSAKRPAGAPAAPAVAMSRDTSAAGKKKDIEGVFVVDTTTMTARFRPVHVGITGDDYFEVISGVREGETIVAGPYQAIRDLKNRSKVRGQQGHGPGGATPAHAS
ncbi:MAG TPA: efflux RND transporter periplasmic adaptor subunit [Gemmatimonadales bacterium]|jgi:HlyD family secretion protein